MALTYQNKRMLFAASLLIVCLWGTVQAFRYTAASLDFYFVRNIISLWQQKGEKQSEEQFNSAKLAIESALEYHGDHPLYVDLMAQIHEWGAIAGYEDKGVALSQAKARYLEATKLRPAWPVTWASLVMVKWRMNEFDQEMLDYLNKANELGPRKPEVHILYTELGLALYKGNNLLFLDIRDEVHRRIALGLQNNQSREAVINSIKRHEAQKQVCRWLKDEKEWIRNLIPQCKV